jgi:hypothetical protein
MNERIEELIKQADYNAPGGQWKEYFAELIVRECIEDCRDMFIVGSVSWNLLNEKLEHFGVE